MLRRLPLSFGIESHWKLEKGSSNTIFAFWKDHPYGMVKSGLKGTRVSQRERRFGWDDLEQNGVRGEAVGVERKGLM